MKRVCLRLIEKRGFLNKGILVFAFFELSSVICRKSVKIYMFFFKVAVNVQFFSTGPTE